METTRPHRTYFYHLPLAESILWIKSSIFRRFSKAELRTCSKAEQNLACEPQPHDTWSKRHPYPSGPASFRLSMFNPLIFQIFSPCSCCSGCSTRHWNQVSSLLDDGSSCQNCFGILRIMCQGISQVILGAAGNAKAVAEQQNIFQMLRHAKPQRPWSSLPSLGIKSFRQVVK